MFKEGTGVPGLLAVQHDATGQGKALALAYGAGIGCARAGIVETTFKEEADYTTGPRLVDDETRARMRQILKEIQNGEFAKKWILENQAGKPSFNAMRARAKEHPSEKVGAELRAMMSWINK
jgi:ketol-acid reductoisomerase